MEELLNDIKDNYDGEEESTDGKRQDAIPDEEEKESLLTDNTDTLHSIQSIIDDTREELPVVEEESIPYERGLSPRAAAGIGEGAERVKDTVNVVGEIVKNAGSSLVELPTKVTKVGALGVANVFEAMGNNQDVIQGARQVAASSDKALDTIDSTINKMFEYLPTAENEKQKMVADVATLIAGGYKGAEKALEYVGKEAPGLLKAGAGIFGGMAGEVAVGSGRSNEVSKEPLFTGKDSTVPILAKNTEIDPDVSQLIVSPLESVPLQVAVNTVVKGVKALGKGASKEENQAVYDMLKTYQEIEGNNKKTSEELAIQALRNAMYNSENGKEIDPFLPWLARRNQDILDKNTPLYNIEGQLFDIPKNAPLNKFRYTSRIQRAEQREAVYLDRILKQNIPARVGDGIGEDVLTDMTINGTRAGSMKDIVDEVDTLGKESGLTIHDATRYRHDQRLMRDYELSLATDDIKYQTGNIDEQIKTLREEKQSYIDGRKVAKTTILKEFDNKIAKLQEDKKLIEESAGPARRGIGDDIEEVEARIQDIEARDPEWAAKVNELFSIQSDGLLQYLKQFGNIDDETIARLKATYGDKYFPAPRDFDNVPIQKNEGVTTISRGKGIKSAEGGKAPYMNPTDAWVWHMAMTAGAGARNDTLNGFMDLFDKLDARNWEKIFNTPKESYLKQLKVDKAAIEEGIVSDKKEFHEMFGTSDDYDIGFAGDIGLKDNTITLYRNGKPIRLSIKDENVLKSFQGLTKGDAKWAFDTAVKLRDIERGIYTLNPGFVAANILMDSTYGALRSETGQKPLINIIQGAMTATKHPDWWRFYLNQMGVRQGFYGASRRETAVQDVQEALLKNRKDFEMNNALAEPLKDSQSKIKSVPKKLLASLEKIGTYGENVARFAEWSNTIKQGESSALGVDRANELTLNFHRSGSSQLMKDVNALSVFVNASLQGLSNTSRLLKENPWRFPAIAFKYITLPSIAVYEWNLKVFGPELYYDIPKETRERNHIIRYGWEKDDYVLIPKERLVSPFAAGIPQAYFDDIYEKTGSVAAVHQAVKAFLTPFDLPSLVPVVAQPVIEIMLNENRYGKPLVSSYTDGLPTAEQYSPYTSPTYKLISDSMGLSPIKVQTLGQEIGGELNRVLLSFTDPVVRKAMGYPEQLEESKLPIGGRFLPDGRYANVDKLNAMRSYVQKESINYESMAKQYEFYTSDRGLSSPDKAQRDRAIKYVNENKEFITFKESLDAVSEQMGEYYKAVTDIYNSDADLDVKKEKVKELKEAQEILAKNFINNVVKKNDNFRKYLGMTENYNLPIPIPGIDINASRVVNERIIEPLGLEGLSE
jgi:hypothetical protein